MQYGSYTDDFDDYTGETPESSSFDRDEDAADASADGHDSPRGGGHGRARDDDDRSLLMPMSRRDPVRAAKDLHRSSIDDMRRFLRERDSGMPDPMQSVSSVAVIGLEIIAGALAGGYLSQRFRQAGAVVPVGVTLAALGLAGSQFGIVGKFSPDLRMVSFGALASAVALWAAGRGIITAEATTLAPQATPPAALPTTAVPFPAHAPSAPAAAPASFPAGPYVPPSIPYVPRTAGAPAPHFPAHAPSLAAQHRPASMAGFQNLVARTRRAA